MVKILVTGGDGRFAQELKKHNFVKMNREAWKASWILVVHFPLLAYHQ